MNIRELMAILEEAKESRGLTDESEVIIGDQPHYPFGTSISGAVTDHTFCETLSYNKNGEPRSVLVLTEGHQLAYGNKAWWNGEDIPAECEHEWIEVDAEPPYNVCISCGARDD